MKYSEHMNELLSISTGRASRKKLEKNVEILSGNKFMHFLKGICCKLLLGSEYKHKLTK